MLYLIMDFVDFVKDLIILVVGHYFELHLNLWIYSRIQMYFFNCFLTLSIISIYFVDFSLLCFIDFGGRESYFLSLIVSKELVCY